MVKLDNLSSAKVEILKLSKIASIQKGTQLNKELFVPDGAYPVLNGGKSFSGYYNDFNTKENTITVTQGGCPGLVNLVETKFWLGAHCYSVIPKVDFIQDRNLDYEIFNKFLFYFLKYKEDYLKSLSNGTTIKDLKKKHVEELEIPILSTDLQIKIIQYLDIFTQILNELEKEVGLREAQLEYYMRGLIDGYQADSSFDNYQLGTITEIKRGQRSFTKESYKEGSLYPVLTGGKEPSGYADIYNREANTTIMVVTGAAGFVNFIKTKFWMQDPSVSIIPHESFVNQHQLNYALFNKFVYYVVKRHQELLMQSKRASLFGAASKEVLANIQVPLVEQSLMEKCVAFLDNLDDLKTELEQEIKLREEQYKYYANWLFSKVSPSRN